MEEKPLILIIEDSEDVVDLYRFMIVHAGYRVATATDGAVGLAMIRDLHPQVVILDVMMPHMTGLELLEQLKDEPPQTRPQVIVNSGNESFRDEALAAGAQLFLQKPVVGDDLLAAIEMVLYSGRQPEAGARAAGDGFARHAADGAATRRRERAARATLLAGIDLTSPAVQVRAKAMVRWLADYLGYGTVSIEVLKDDQIYVVAAEGDSSLDDGAERAEDTFSGAVIAGREPLLVGDTASSTIFSRHPAVLRGERFYAGVPLVSSIGPLGALSVTDRIPHRFYGEDMTVLDYLAVGIARRYEALSNLPSSGPYIFDLPGIFTREALHLLLSTELQRAARTRDGVIEFALVQLQRDDPALIARAADVGYQSDARKGLAIAQWAPLVLALLVRTRSASVERPGLQVVLTAFARAGVPVRGTGLLRYRSSGPPLLSQHEIERMTDEARAIAAGRTVGRIEHVLLQSDPQAVAVAP